MNNDKQQNWTKFKLFWEYKLGSWNECLSYKKNLYRISTQLTEVMDHSFYYFSFLSGHAQGTLNMSLAKKCDIKIWIFEWYN